MPEFKVYLHELYCKAKRIPNVHDCFLIECVEERTGKQAFDTPWHAQFFGPLRGAWGDLTREEWNYNWGWNRKTDNTIRIEGTCDSVNHPIALKFRWREGYPKTDGIEILPCWGEKPKISEWRYNRCYWCGKHIEGFVGDCPGRRLNAIAESVLKGDPLEQNLKAINLWHKKESPFGDAGRMQ